MNTTFQTISESYHQTLIDLLDHPQYKTAPRGLPIHEILNYSFTVRFPTPDPVVTLDLERNVKIAEYTKKEFELYNKGTNKSADFAEASKFWNKVANPDGTLNSAYGYLIFVKKSCGQPFYEHLMMHPELEVEHAALTDEQAEQYMRTPWEWAKKALIDDEDTRQSIMPFSLPEHCYGAGKDLTCTTHGHFFIRHNELHLIMTMRSQDAWKGAVYDIPWFVSLQCRMVKELRQVYPKLTTGMYTHRADSMHLYEKDIDAAMKAVGRTVMDKSSRDKDEFRRALQIA